MFLEFELRYKKYRECHWAPVICGSPQITANEGEGRQQISRLDNSDRQDTQIETTNGEIYVAVK